MNTMSILGACSEQSCSCEVVEARECGVTTNDGDGQMALGGKLGTTLRVRPTYKYLPPPTSFLDFPWSQNSPHAFRILRNILRERHGVKSWLRVVYGRGFYSNGGLFSSLCDPVAFICLISHAHVLAVTLQIRTKTGSFDFDYAPF